MQISRRRFAHFAGTAALAGPPLLAQGSSLTAQQVVDRIRKNAGVPWQPQSLDNFKAGDPATPVMGIATTGMATIRATMPNDDELLWPGTLVNAHLTLRTEEAVIVPSAAVQVSQQGNFVYLVKDNVAHVTPVKVARSTIWSGS